MGLGFQRTGAEDGWEAEFLPLESFRYKQRTKSVTFYCAREVHRGYTYPVRLWVA